MSLKKVMKLSGFRLTVLFLALAFAFVVGTCEDETFVARGGIPGSGTPGSGTPGSGTPGEGTPGEGTPGEIIPPIPSIDYSTELDWGNLYAPENLGLSPGNDTTEIRLNWITSGSTSVSSDKAGQVRFIQGTREAGYELIEETGDVGSASSSSGIYHRVAVTGLEPGKSYQYSVSTDGKNWSEMYDFNVPPATGEWKFAVISDPQIAASGTIDTKARYKDAATNAIGWLNTMAKVLAANVSFIVGCGDQVDSTTTTTVVAEYKSFFAPPALRSLPFAHTIGNHDTATNYRYYYNQPNDSYRINTSDPRDVDQLGNYYYLYNNILFVVLNTSAGSSTWTTSNATTYITRFENTIKAAKLAHPNYDWLIVHHHKSTASVAEHAADKDIQAYVVAGFEKLMSDQFVDFVLAGHDHVYARSYPLYGLSNGLVSLPDKTTTTENGARVTAIPGKPIYLTFSSSSGQKYYQVPADPYSSFTGSMASNTTYPYLGANDAGTVTSAGSTTYTQGKLLPVSNMAFVQPYIPSYCIVEVDGRSITFSTYAIASRSGTEGTNTPYSFDENVPYDTVTVTK